MLIGLAKSVDVSVGTVPSSVNRIAALLEAVQSSNANEAVNVPPFRENSTFGEKPAPTDELGAPGVGTVKYPTMSGAP